MATSQSFFSVVSEAINHYAEWGFTSQADLEQWVARIRRAALLHLRPPQETENLLRKALGAKYTRLVTKGDVLKSMPTVGRMTLDKVKPKLRAELDRRIMSSASLISLNRQGAVDDTLRRFQGWATSIPAGGSRAVDIKDEKERVRKSISSMGFIERRVVIDQTHKLVASINEIVAVDAGALALIWHSPWRRAGYAYREEHKERDDLVYAIRGNWALEKGFMKPGSAGYYDEVTAVGQEVYCSCTAQYIFNLRSLPDNMLTKKGMYALP